MKDTAKKDILKYLSNNIIYHISKSVRVSYVQVVPKKFGINMVKNYANELTLMCIYIGMTTSLVIY